MYKQINIIDSLIVSTETESVRSEVGIDLDSFKRLLNKNGINSYKTVKHY